MDLPDSGAATPRAVRRHNIVTRLWHWLNAGVIVVMLMSGLAIFNAHPRLYWGSYGANPDPAWLEIGAEEEIGYLKIGTASLETTGVLGYSADPGGDMRARGFPSWATLPGSSDLAMARRWHVTFAWVMVPALALYALVSLLSGHLWRDLIPSRGDLHPRALWHCCRDHALLRFPRGREAIYYNPLQKISYFVLLVILLPAMVLSGLAMSPSAVAGAPWLLDIFGGRQSARSVHFIAAGGIVAFVVLHLVMVVAVGSWNHLRSMITGRFRVPPEAGE